eukprot:981649_1
MSMHVFYQPLVRCYNWFQPTLSWFDVLCGFVCATLIAIWLHHTCKGKCSRYWKVVIWLLVFASPIIKEKVTCWIASGSFGGGSVGGCNTNDYDVIQSNIGGWNKINAYISFYVFAGLQVILPICWTMMVNKQMIKSIWCTKLPKCDHVCTSISKCTGNVCLWIVLFVVIVIWSGICFAELIQATEFEVSARCVDIAFQTVFAEPMFWTMMILDIYLCISGSKAVYPTLFYIFIQSIIALFGIIEDSVCLFALNIQYIALSIFAPIYVIIIFWIFKELNQWKTGLISMYLISFDLISD